VYLSVYESKVPCDLLNFMSWYVELALEIVLYCYLSSERTLLLELLFNEMIKC